MKQTRRQFLRTAAAGALTLYPWNQPQSRAKSSLDRPNILWISCEDISPDLGCYGDDYAVTPNLDKFAAQSVRYTNAFTPAGVCAPCRSATITGMYQSSIGTCPMRCKGVPPVEVKCFPEYLRAAGYYCSNRSKTDYQFDAPLSAWDDCSNKGHWRNRAPGQPFFAVINLTSTHESQIRNQNRKKQIATLSPAEKHDPAQAKIPPYYPDTPIVREDWAQYYDIITLADKDIARILQDLQDDGLAEDTIVWFWGDHGRGLPRCKRWVYDSGLRVPLIVRIPEKYRKLAHPHNPAALKPGAVNDELVSFVDFAPAMLSLAGVKIPSHLQGRPFLGPDKPQTPRRYIYGARDRIDESLDLVRAVHEKRFHYVRNFMWHVTYGQNVEYMNQMPTMREMRRLHAEGKLKGPEKQYFRETRDPEELFDLEKDPYEINNLAGDPKYQDVLLRMRKELYKWMKDINDVGLIPEADFDAIKRTGDKYETTANPVFLQEGSAKDKPAQVAIECPTPGASISYRTDGKDGKTGWQLYTAPVTLHPGETLKARAGRIGFKDSQTVTFKLGDAPMEFRPLPAKKHWREKIDPNLLDRLFALKEYDGKGAAGIPAYMKALTDKAAPMRYWAVIGLRAASQQDASIKKPADTVEKLLSDDSVSVRVAAAETLCAWDRPQKALPLLIDTLQNSHASGRHFAAESLMYLGDKARPAIPALKQALNQDNNGNVKNTARHALRALNAI